jgi:hypothetical protein
MHLIWLNLEHTFENTSIWVWKMLHKCCWAISCNINSLALLALSSIWKLAFTRVCHTDSLTLFLLGLTLNILQCIMFTSLVFLNNLDDLEKFMPMVLNYLQTCKTPTHALYKHPSTTFVMFKSIFLFLF